MDRNDIHFHGKSHDSGSTCTTDREKNTRMVGKTKHDER